MLLISRGTSSRDSPNVLFHESKDELQGVVTFLYYIDGYIKSFCFCRVCNEGIIDAKMRGEQEHSVESPSARFSWRGAWMQTP